MLKINNVCKHFIKGSTRVDVLTNFNMEISRGEVVAVVGKSGAGKSTLMHIIGGLDRPSSGEVSFDGNSVSQMKKGELDNYRGSHVGFVFQFHFLLDDFTALENVMLPALIMEKDQDKVRNEAMELLRSMGIETRANHYPGEMSGGEQQRTAIARALINAPSVILADEPTGNLDSANTEEVFNILMKLKERNAGVLLVTHDEEMAGRCDRIIRIEKR